jgi:hypothetical protein
MSSLDPFAPPSADTSGAAEPLPAERPTGVPKAFGVLSIIFASRRPRLGDGAHDGR